jgi:hypothetical protein
MAVGINPVTNGKIEVGGSEVLRGPLIRASTGDTLAGQANPVN